MLPVDFEEFELVCMLCFSVFFCYVFFFCYYCIYKVNFSKNLWGREGRYPWFLQACVTESRLDAHFEKKIPLSIIIGQQMKEEGLDQNY